MAKLQIPAPPGKDTPARRRAREALARVLWTPDGVRRLPGERELATALRRCSDQDAWWVCEASSTGPLYFLPTREWVRLLAASVKRWRARSVLEVGAGDGFLAACLRNALPGVKVVATDNGAWTRPSARMNASDRRHFRGISFSGIRMDGVERLGVTAAVKRYRPDLVVCAWPPPGLMIERAIRGPCRHVLEITVDGDVCGNSLRQWRFTKEFIEGPLETRAFCRFDGGGRPPATRLVLYNGARHPEFGVNVDGGWLLSG